MPKLNTSQSKISQLIAPNFKAKFRRLEKYRPKDKALKRWLARSAPAGLVFELTGTQKGPQMLAVVAAISDSSLDARLRATTQLLVVGSVLPERRGLVNQMTEWIKMHTSHPDHYNRSWSLETGGILLAQRLDSQAGLFTLSARSLPCHPELQPALDVVAES